MPIVGTWEWRTYLPAVVNDDDLTVGMFVYADDAHEIDLECGWGSGNGWREAAQAVGNELVCGMTVQGVGASLVKRVAADAFHDFRLQITSTEARFTVDGQFVGAIPLGYDPSEYSWRSIISAENLWWMGASSTQQASNYAYTSQQYGPAFDRVIFKH